MRWLMPGAPELQLGKTKQHVWIHPKSSTAVKIITAGHLVRCHSEPLFVCCLGADLLKTIQIPQEAPQELGMCFEYILLRFV